MFWWYVPFLSFYISTFMSRAIPKICSSVCRFLLTRVSALSPVIERVSPQVQGQYSVIQEQPFDGKCSSFGPRGDAPRWNHRTILDVEILLARSGGFKDLKVVKMKPLATVCSSLPKELDEKMAELLLRISRRRNGGLCTIGSGSTWPKEVDEKVAELHFQILYTEIFFVVVTWISPGVPSAGFTRHKKSELRAHQIKFDGHLAQKSELSSHQKARMCDLPV